MSNIINIPITGSKPIILIDQSYYVFNRYYATCNWYSHQKDKNLNLDNIENNTDFIMAFFRHFENDINKIIKKYKTIKSNIIFCCDCTRCEIWRNVIYNDYKSTRIKKENFDGTIFNLFKNYISNNDYNYCESNNLEADDITYIIQRKIKDEFRNYSIVIITNDNDYLQMYDMNTTIINMQFKDISLRIKTNPMIELEFKIIYGDKSDNIQKIQTGLKKNDAFKLANMNKEDRNKYLIEHNLMEKYLLNKRLVDLTEIPEKLINDFNSKYNIIKR
jgi:5'-3' exonuclease